ncbi:MAG TPA: efflux RND transporter periplasmic adaptor subunit [Candidatus Acidoferrum sp.]|nr:efflux RND transporter periplasmic adaptor subunit [Candidatus Acidoferrum sp.]
MRWPPGSLALLGILSFFAAGCSRDSTASTDKAAPAKGPKAVEVRVIPAAEVRMPRTVGVSGTLAADDLVVLSLKVPGRISELKVDLGTRVKKGQIVARLDPTDYRLRVEQAQATLVQARVRLGLPADGADDRVDPEKTALVRQARAVLEEARLTRERFAKLLEQQFVAKAQFDTAVANEQVADGRYQDAIEEVRNRQSVLVQRRTELEMARQALTDTELLAPVDGMIRERRTATGEFLSAGAPVATLVKIHPLRLQLAVPERAAASVRVGQEVRVSVDGDAGVHAGRVVRLSPSIQEQNRTLMLEAEVPNQAGTLRPGSFTRAEIVIAADQPAIFVPASSIVVFAGIEKVLTIKEGKALERRVVTGRREKDRVEIVEGLKVGEAVVIDPGNLVGGQAVVVKP